MLYYIRAQAESVRIGEKEFTIPNRGLIVKRLRKSKITKLSMCDLNDCIESLDNSKVFVTNNLLDAVVLCINASKIMCIPFNVYNVETQEQVNIDSYINESEGA